MAVTIADRPAGIPAVVVQNGEGTRRNRHDATHYHFWIRTLSRSTDPASVTSPALNGACPGGSVVGPL